MIIVSCQNHRCRLRKPINQMVRVDNQHYCCAQCAITAEEAETEVARKIAAEQLKHTSFRFMVDLIGKRQKKVIV